MRVGRDKLWYVHPGAHSMMLAASAFKTNRPTWTNYETNWIPVFYITCSLL